MHKSHQSFYRKSSDMGGRASPRPPWTLLLDCAGVSLLCSPGKIFQQCHWPAVITINKKSETDQVWLVTERKIVIREVAGSSLTHCVSWP